MVDRSCRSSSPRRFGFDRADLRSIPIVEPDASHRSGWSLPPREPHDAAGLGAAGRGDGDWLTISRDSELNSYSASIENFYRARNSFIDRVRLLCFRQTCREIANQGGRCMADAAGKYRDRRRAPARSSTASEGLEGPLLPILHGIQAEFGYVPPRPLPVIAEALNLSRAEVHGVVTFYHDFREPAGRPPCAEALPRRSLPVDGRRRARARRCSDRSASTSARPRRTAR